VEPVDPRDQRIAELEAALALVTGRLTRQLEAALARIAQLEAEVTRLSRNSTNSSKPPSSDPPGVTRPGHTPSGNKRGGQPGHKFHKRKLLPPDQVSRVVPLVPIACCGCGAALHGRDRDPLRHQVVDMPPVRPEVTEYQRHALTCACGVITRAPLPSGVPTSSFGPRLSAMIAILTAKYRLPKRGVRELLSDFLGVELALGSVANVEQNVSAALEAPVAEARAYVHTSAVIHADETGWREAKKKAWLWVAATSLVTVFVIAASRSSKVAKDMIGQAFSGVLTTDRWSAYNWVDCWQRQLCWVSPHSRLPRLGRRRWPRRAARRGSAD
jgi:transposase